MPLSDTSPEMQAFYFQGLRQLTPEQRIQRGISLWEAGDAMQRSAIHRDHPGVGDADLRYRLAVLRYGPELADSIFGGQECR